MGHPLPQLWPDPAQRSRIADIRDNLTARISEAEREGWLGEIEGLKISIAGQRQARPDRPPRQPPARRSRFPRHTAASPLSVVAQNLTGSGQTISVYGQYATSSTLTLYTGPGGITLAAFQVA